MGERVKMRLTPRNNRDYNSPPEKVLLDFGDIDWGDLAWGVLTTIFIIALSIFLISLAVWASRGLLFQDSRSEKEAKQRQEQQEKAAFTQQCQNIGKWGDVGGARMSWSCK